MDWPKHGSTNHSEPPQSAMIRVCIFGAGRIGAVHAATAAQHPAVEIKYIVDVCESAAQRVAERHRAAVSGADEALADARIDAVIIASSTATHAELIERSARAGKAIFCEKPLDLDLARAERCRDLVEAAGVVCAIGFNRRFDAQFAALKEAIDRPAIGRLEMLSITSRDPCPPPIDYVRASGGLFKDMMIHDFDMARWLLGEEPVQIGAVAACHVDPAIAAAGDVDSAVVTLKTATGRLCQISNSRRSAYGYDQRIEALGSRGMAQAGNLLDKNVADKNVADKQVTISTAPGVGGAGPQPFFLQRYAQAYRCEIEHFIDCVQGKTRPLIGAHDGVQALRLARAAGQSLQSGRLIELPPQ